MIHQLINQLITALFLIAPTLIAIVWFRILRVIIFDNVNNVTFIEGKRYIIIYTYKYIFFVLSR